MSPLLIGVLSFLLLFLLIFLQVPVGVAMAVAGIVACAALVGLTPAMHILPIEIYHSLASPELALVILFVLMGNLAGLAGLPRDLYRLAASLIGHRPGGLAMTTVASAAGFGAICGSSVATTATMTRMALPEMRRYYYGERLAAGSIAAGSTLGIIVPPSIVLILYGILTEQAINHLFIAAIIPALLAVACYLLAIAWVAWRHPAQAPAHQRPEPGEVRRAARQSIAFFLLAGAVGGGLYSGLLTINEAASVGVILSLVIAAKRGVLSRRGLGQSLIETASTTGMIYLVLIGAGVYAYAMTLSGLPGEIVSLISDSGLSPIAIIFMLELMYIVLGSIFDTVAAMVVTLPFVFPLVTGLGYDPIWWGIINVMVMEIGMITPPIGINVFVLHGMVPELSLRTIYSGIIPFLIVDLMRLALLTLVPTLMIIL
jgi:C4-dicarboxylate transporter, DctM subunit